MDRYTYEGTGQFEKRPVRLIANISIGASGAPTLNFGRGIASVTRNSAGDYTIALQDQYQKLLMARHIFVSTTGTDAALEMLVKADSTNNASPSVEVTFNVAAGTATDPSNGAVLLLELFIRRSSAPV